MSHKIWLRVKLPAEALADLLRDFPACELRQGDDADVDPAWLGEADGVFTEEPLSDALVRRMPNLKWLHVMRRFAAGEPLRNLIDKELGY